MFSSTSVYQSREDPGLFILYHDQPIHEALALPGAPVPQGATIEESAKSFKRWVTGEIAKLCPAESLVKLCFPPPDDVLHGGYHHLSHEHLHQIRRLFQNGTWSAAVEAAGLQLGIMVQVVGGEMGNITALALHTSSGPFKCLC